MNISGIIKSSLIDYPGLISCVLFVPGCNYSCYYCHNRFLIDGTHILLAPQYVMGFLEKRAGLVDGVVVSGGEPTLQTGLATYLQKLKELGYSVKLDTNGSNPEVIKELLENHLCDYISVDYKAPASHYTDICGEAADSQKVIETIAILLQTGIPFEVRTTVLPSLKVADLITMAKELPCLPRYVLNRYRVPEKYLTCDKEKILARPYTQEELNTIAGSIAPFQPNIAV